LPPLDGSHVIRHFLSYDTQRVYDRFGYGALIVVLFILPMIGFNLVGIMIAPFMYFYQALLAVFLGFR
jgi:Zn-dependent protease